MKVKDIRGVNLGGWLVLERWITPSLFEGVRGPDEHALSTELSRDEAAARLAKHRRTFFTKKHMKQVKALGLNAVRVPVGYWIFDDCDGFIGGGYRYLDKLFVWAEEYDLQVLLCLHGAPGSQNGWDHSGRAGAIGWHDNENNLRRTLEIIERICLRYGQNAQLFGVELLNEPHPTVPLRELMRYYRHGARSVRRYCRRGVRWVVSDAFRPQKMVWRMVLRWFYHPVVDQHMYQLYTPEDRRLDLVGHLDKVSRWQVELRCRRYWVDVMVGEWSAAMDELYLEELRKTAKAYTSDDYVRYARAQQNAYKAAGCGWFYWTARTEDSGVWSLLDHPDLLGI